MTRPAIGETLDALGRRCGTDKAAPTHAYTRFYPFYLERFRDAPVRFLEVGVFRGASCRMWDEYFRHPEARLFAIDRKRRHLRNVPRSPRWRGLRGDQSDPTFLGRVREEVEALDVVVEDGQHIPRYQIQCFESLWPVLRPGGIYAIEDIDTSFDDDFFERRTREAGGPRSIMPYLHGLLERLVPASEPEQTDLAYVHFYPHAVVIGRR